MASTLTVEVAYGTRADQRLITLDVPPGTSAREAIERSGILKEFPEIDLAAIRVGIFSEPVALDQILAAQDRVEIFRPLLIDPKDARRNRARHKSGKRRA